MRQLVTADVGVAEDGTLAAGTVRPFPERATTDWPTVSVLLPVRNEHRNIAESLASVLAQDYPRSRMEVIVVDGSSTDGTAAIARSVLGISGGEEGRSTVGLARALVIDNPEAIVPVAMNRGIAAASGTYIVRVDGHCQIESNYVRRSVELLMTGKYVNVGGRCVAVGDTPWAKAIAAAQSSRFGVGNVDFRTGTIEAGETDTVPFGAWQRNALINLGGFDEELVRNQDDELNFRVAQQGGVVWFDPEIVSYYRGRDSLGGLWRQYFQYGQYKVRVMQKRRGVASPRHLVPAGFVAGALGSVVAGTVRRNPLVISSGLLPYVVVVTAASRAAGRRHGAAPWRVALAMATLHFGYGLGSWSGAVKFRKWFFRSGGHTVATHLTVAADDGAPTELVA